jgi:hypothetical protein
MDHPEIREALSSPLAAGGGVVTTPMVQLAAKLKSGAWP